MKWSLQQISEAWERCRQAATSKEDFQNQWQKILDQSGWTREEFSRGLDQYQQDLLIKER